MPVDLLLHSDGHNETLLSDQDYLEIIISKPTSELSGFLD
jgi:hypothetical protein